MVGQLRVGRAGHPCRDGREGQGHRFVRLLLRLCASPPAPWPASTNTPANYAEQLRDEVFHKVERLFLADGKRERFAAWVLLFYALWHRTHVLGKAPDGDIFHCLTDC